LIPPKVPVRHEVEIEVRYAETDQMGWVHHANYLVWFELARTALCRRSGHPYSEIEAQGYFLVVTATETRYLRGARYGESVRVAAWVDRLGSRGLRFGYEVTSPAGLLASGATEHVWVERASGRPCRTPEILRDAFAILAGAAGSLPA